MKHFGTDIIRGLNLYQSAGERCFCHSSHTVLCVLDGTLRAAADQTEYMFKEQGVLLIPCGRNVEFSGSGSCVCLILRLSPVFLMEAFSRDRLLSEVISSTDIPTLRELLPDLLSLVPLYQESADRNRLEINRVLFSVLGELDRILEPEPSSLQDQDTAPLSRQQNVDAYITANIEKQISLQETAAACGLTPQYLSSFFQKSMNCTFMEYINRIKAEKACEWLLCSDLSPEEVCDIAGFKTFSAFRKSIGTRYGCSWDELQDRQAAGFRDLPEEDIIRNPSIMLYSAVQPAEEKHTPSEPVLHIRKEVIEAETRPDQPAPDTWRTILNIGSAGSLFFEPFLRMLNVINEAVSFRYCRMYNLLHLVTAYATGGRTYYGFELVFQNLDSVIRAGLIPFLDLGYRDLPGHRTPVTTFAFNADPIDIYYEKLVLILPEFLRAAVNRYGRNAVEQWVLEFHFSYQNNRNYTFWQFITAYRKAEAAARTVLPDVCIGGLGFDAALHPGAVQSMLEQLKSMDCRLDFTSIHVNGLVLPQVNGSGNFRYVTDENEIDRRVTDTAAVIRRYYARQPLYITEFGFAHFLRSALNDSMFQASFILRFLTLNAPKVDGVGYHMMDDLGEIDRPVDREFFGCAGLFSTHGLRKPSYYAFSFLSQLGKSVLSTGVNHILTARSRFSYQLAAFYYRHIPETPDHLCEDEEVRSFEKWCAENGDRLQLHFRIRGADPGRYLVKTLRLQPGKGDLHKLWLYHSSVLNTLNETDYAFFRRYMVPEITTEPCTVPASGELTLDLMLAPMETVLLLMDRSAV